jgi:photosystem II stability/assembly factor-like uncharacterized protein
MITRAVKPIVLLVALLIIQAAERPAHAQSGRLYWQPLGGPAGRVSLGAATAGGQEWFVVAVAEQRRRDDESPTTSGAGSPRRSDALYASANRGAGWRPAGNGLPPAPIHALSADPAGASLLSIIRAGSGDQLWDSPDGGLSWQRRNLGGGSLALHDLVRGPLPGQVYLAADDDRTAYLLRSGDGGVSWQAAPVGPPGEILAPAPFALTPHPAEWGRLLAIAGDGETLLTTDDGASWERVAGPKGAPAVAAFHPGSGSDGLMVRGGQPLEVLQSADGGGTWQPMSPRGLPSSGTPGALLALHRGVVLLNLDATTFRSIDGGRTWQGLEGPLASTAVGEFVVAPETTSDLMAVTGAGVFLSRDAGALWQPSDTGLPANSHIAGLLTQEAGPELFLALPSAQPWPATVAPPAVMRSADGGRRWSPAGEGLPWGRTLVGATGSRSGQFYVVTDGAFYATTDGGVSWTPRGLPSGERATIAVAASDPDTIYLDGSPGLRSTNGGRSWESLTALPDDLPLSGLAVSPTDKRRLWGIVPGAGVVESRDGGLSWARAGLEAMPLRWIKATGTSGGEIIIAGVEGAGLRRRSAAGAAWEDISAGLPPTCTPLAFLADLRSPDLFWATCDGGGVYRSENAGRQWVSASAGIGDNPGLALAADYSTQGGLLMATTTGGIWALRPEPAAGEQWGRAALQASSPPQQTGVDARIEILWPHGDAPVSEARLANIGARLFTPRSLITPECGWTPRLILWQATDSGAAEPVARAAQRTIDGQPFPYWSVNNVDVARATDPRHTLYFMLEVVGVDTASSVWAHGADPRTFLPRPEVPSGVATGPLDAVDALIQVVWPHDESGQLQAVTAAPLANVSVVLFKHGTRLSVPAGWQPQSLTLFGAWNHEVGRPLTTTATVATRQSGAITYPVWEFSNVPVDRAMDPENRLYLWVRPGGVRSYPSIWAHGADARTYYPEVDEPIRGCVP